jgi:peptidoglycan L-alanyl-D-glutamate endopeptidase CwlK
MYHLGKESKSRLSTCCPELKSLVELAIAVSPIDFVVIEGHRDYDRQEQLFSEGKTKVHYPYSKHNPIPSEAVDLGPYVNGNLSWDFNHCCVLAGAVLAVAEMTGIKIRWGGNWDMDGEPITDQDFQDLVHFEKVGP